MTNSDIADHLNLLAKLSDIHGENAFKSKSYSIAAFQLDKLDMPIQEVPRSEWNQLKGIGDSSSRIIAELLDTGDSKQMQALLAKTPPGILELMQIKGLGPKKIALLWQEHGIESPGELWYACMENRLVRIKGFGEKTQQSVLESLNFFFESQKKFLYAQLLPFAEEFETLLRYQELPFRRVGSFGMDADIVEHLEYVVLSDEQKLKETLLYSTWKLVDKQGNQLQYSWNDRIDLFLELATTENFIRQTLIRSSSDEFLEKLNAQFPAVLAPGFESEKTAFQSADLPEYPPCLRYSPDFLEPQHRELPDQLIVPQQIRGIIHAHSTWSDGHHSLEEMARACIQKGYEYLVISDHSVSSFYANGLTAERIKKQHQEIDQLNELLHPFVIFKSIECDILGDGRLDYSDDMLESFDLVISSVHQNLNMTEEKAMQRILAAIRHPSTTILGHPSGRLLLSRKAYPLNYPELIEACVKHQVILEINANPRRLDLDWSWIQMALQKGCKLSINPDAHTLDGIDDVKFGTIAARKGGLTATNNISSLSLEAFKRFVASQK